MGVRIIGILKPHRKDGAGTLESCSVAYRGIPNQAAFHLLYIPGERMFQKNMCF